MSATDRIGTRRRRGLLLVVPALLLLTATGLDAVDECEQDAWMRTQAEARAALELERVLEIVRDHRPTKSEAWRVDMATTIVDEARAAEIDPLLVASIVARESSFQTRAVSSAGAVGLMQLRPWVARATAARSNVEWNGVETLHTPHLNVRLGVSYFKELIERFDDPQIALTAYCYGPTRVSLQVRNGTYRGSRYASEILDLYRRLHGTVTT